MSTADARRLTALRAATARADGPGYAVGIASTVVCEIVIVMLFGPHATPWLWLHVAGMAAVVLVAAGMMFGERLLRPDDEVLVGRWLPFARHVASGYDIVLITSPWVLLPLASPTETGVICLIYGWGMGSAAVFTHDDLADGRRGLIGLPLSLSAYLLTSHTALAVPLSLLFCAAGVSLCFYERAQRRQQRSSYLERIEAERGAAGLLAGLGVEARAEDTTAPARHHVDGLTPRQVEVLRHVAAGRSNKEIARELKISPATVKVHVAQILATTQAVNRTAAAVMLRPA